MRALWPDLLLAVAASLFGAFVATLSFTTLRLYFQLQGRAVAQMDGAAGVKRSSRAFRALRRTVVAALAMLNCRWISPARQEQIGEKLAKAGHPLDLRPTELVALMEVCGVAGGVLGAAGAALLDLSPAWALLLALLGALYPAIWLRDRIKARHHLIARSLPYHLDLLTLSVEAGLDFTAALAKVVEKGRPGPLADELSIALKELRLGKTREEALRNLAHRCDLAVLTGFVQALLQTDRMGTPLGKTLRILSTQMRVERTQRAEKLANEAPVKLLLPLIGCIFPTIFLMLFGPIFYQVFFGGGS